MMLILHVDAIQGSPEKRSEVYLAVHRVSLVGADVVVRHKRRGVGSLVAKQAGGAVQELA